MNRKNLAKIVGIIIFLAIWEIMALANKGVFISHIHRIFMAVSHIVTTKIFYTSLLNTVLIIAMGISIAVIVGIGLAVIMSLNNFCRNAVEPVLNLIRHIPTIALFPTLMALFGVSNFARIVLIALNSFPAIIISAYHGIKSVDKSVIEAGKVDSASNKKIMVAIKIPLAMSEILNGIKIANGNGFVAVVVAEMLGASSGLGFMIMWATNAFNYPEVYAYIFTLSFIGIMINKGFDLFIKKIEGVIYA